MRRVLVLVFPAYVALITTLSVVPMGPELPGQESDKLVHFGAYGLMAFLGLPLASSARLRAMMGCFIVGLGVALEAVQVPIPYRSASSADIVANCLGVLGGSLIWLVLLRRRTISRLTARPHSRAKPPFSGR